MGKTNRKSPRKFIIAICAAAVIVIIGCLVFMSLNANRITEENRQYLKDNTESLAGSLDYELSAGHNNVAILSKLLSNSLRSEKVDITTMQDNVKDSVFDFIEFADVDGNDHNITGGVSDARDRAYYLEAMKGNSGMELIYKSRATHKTLLMFYTPVYYRDKIVGSIVGVYQAANRLTKILTTEYFGESASCYLCTEEGRIVASNKKITPGEEFYIKDVPGVKSGQEKDIRNALRSGKALNLAVKGNDTGGYLMKLPNSEWGVLQIFPEKANEAMIHSANSLATALVVFMAVIWAVVLLILMLFYRNRQAEVEAANEAKTEFLFNMSHDIRTPMNAILGFTEKARRHKYNVKVLTESLDKVQSSGKFLLHIINDILDMAKIESGKTAIEESVTCIDTTSMDLNDIISNRAYEKDIKIEAHYENLENPYVWADEVHVRQVVANLLSNAVKYTDPGGTIDHTVRQLPFSRIGYGKYQIEIRDNGIGMSEEFLAKIFDEFEREKSATQSGEQGTGLGMSIVKKLTELMGGTLDIQSQKGVGTTVTLTFDLRIANDEEIEEYKRLIESEEDKFSRELEGRRILLVEDNELNREIAKDILEEEGAAVEEAEDGDIAVEMVRETALSEGPSYYDIILMDIQMPRMDGFEATRKIRELPELAGVRVPIIALSANAFEEDKRKSLDAGMDDHVAKPIQIDVLNETIRRILN